MIRYARTGPALSTQHGLDIGWSTTCDREHLWKHSFTDIWSLEWEIDQHTGGNWSTRSILVVSSFYFGSILRVPAVFPGLIYSGYCGYCKGNISDVCTAGGIRFTAHVPSTRSIWAFSTADTASTRSIHLGHINSIVPQSSQYQQHPEYRTETHITSGMYREGYTRSTDIVKY